jgi:hypothetical protein
MSIVTSRIGTVAAAVLLAVALALFGLVATHAHANGGGVLGSSRSVVGAEHVAPASSGHQADEDVSPDSSGRHADE